MHHQWPFTEIPGLSDDQRPWFCLDYGNFTNYVINQGTALKRTFGIVGAWHRDPGSTVPGPGTAGVGWSPSGSASSIGTSGSFSAWCGLRAHGDLTVQDLATGVPGPSTGAVGGTGNYFNETTILTGGSRAPTAFPPGSTTTAKRFPGYMAQWDQELYRDVYVPAATNLTVAFRYRTRMSINNSTSPNNISGWYDKDPINKIAGNFISASANLAPVAERAADRSTHSWCM
jgi:hypothetical protein